MNARRVAELLRMQADLTAKLAEVLAELAAAYGDEAPANETGDEKPTRRAPKPTLVRVPARKREPSELARAQADAALRELGYK